MFEFFVKPLPPRLRREGRGSFTSAKWGAILLFKQPEDGINFPERTRIQNAKLKDMRLEVMQPKIKTKSELATHEFGE